MEPEHEQHGLLKSATFRQVTQRHTPQLPSTEDILTKVFGTKNAPTQRVSESLDYEPVQNKIFYKRMKAAKEKKHLFGYEAVHDSASRRCCCSCCCPCPGCLLGLPHAYRAARSRSSSMNASSSAHAARGRPPPPQHLHPSKHPPHPPHRRRRHFLLPCPAPPSYTGHTFAKFLITITSGLLTGVFAVALSQLVHHSFEWKNEYVQSILDEPGEGRIWIAFLWHCAYSCLLVSFAVALVSGRHTACRAGRAAAAARNAAAPPGRASRASRLDTRAMPHQHHNHWA
jgi:hypothetical protein